MKIVKFEFEDRPEGWKLSETRFNDSLTLLVGASGVGKTMILQALRKMKSIVRGNSFTGAHWNIEFVSGENKHYCWQGAFQNQGIGGWWVPPEVKEEDRTKIEWEALSCNDKTIIERNQEGILFFGKKTLKLSSFESALSLFGEEDVIKPVRGGFGAIRFADFTDPGKTTLYGSRTTLHSTKADLSYVNNTQNEQNINSLEGIQKADLPHVSKLFLLEKCDPHEFSVLHDRFVSIFPQVQAIKSAPLKNFDENRPFTFQDPFFRGMLRIQIKEHGVDRWIEPSKISSGMFRVINQLCDIYLNPEGTVFLIDEFENSLGINCIKEITQDIISQNRQFQFIVTSHHPYIINNIDVGYWKLVTRNGGIVKTHSLSDLGCDFTKSHHDTFMQLLQLEEYRTGQEQSQ